MRVAVTRTKDQLYELAGKAAAKNIEIIPLPLMEIHNLAFSWPDDINLESLGWVFFTSANGVEAFFSRLDSVGCHLSRHTRFAVVGKKTEEALAERGYVASFQPSEAYGRLLFSEFVERHPECNQTVAYARAREVDFEPVDLFTKRKLDYRAVICYESIERSVGQHVVSRIKREDAILFTAPSMVRAYHRQFGNPEARLLAIGQTTAAEMQRYRWANFIVLSHADVNTVLEYV
jgi:uroporphyrinogen-III synthase